MAVKLIGGRYRELRVLASTRSTAEVHVTAAGGQAAAVALKLGNKGRGVEELRGRAEEHRGRGGEQRHCRRRCKRQAEEAKPWKQRGEELAGRQVDKGGGGGQLVRARRRARGRRRDVGHEE